MHLKKSIILLSKKFYFLHIMFTLISYLKPDVKKDKVLNFEIIHAFIKFLFYNACQNISLFFFNTINIFRELSLIKILIKNIIKKIPFLSRFYYEINLPANLTKENGLKHFLNRDYYYLKPSVIKKTKNSYLYLETYFGIVFKNLKINKSSIHGNYDRRSKEILKPYNNIIFENYIAQAYLKEGTIIIPEEGPKYLLIHNWFNYFHWILESLYRYFTVIKDVKDFTLVLPDTFKNIQFVQDTLAALDVKTVYFKNSSVLKFKELHFVSQKKYCDIYEPIVLERIRAYFCDYVNIKGIKSPIDNERVFILRKSTYARSIKNLDEVCELLKKYDFALVDFEAYSFFEQVAIMQQTKYLVATHGAGLTNMLFMPEGASVFELHKSIKVKTDHHSVVYWRLAGALKHSYFFQFCDYVTFKDETSAENRKSNVNFELHSFYLNVDVELFEENLCGFLGN